MEDPSMTLQLNGPCPLISVFDMPTSLRFYRDTLGFEVISRSGQADDCGWAWLRLGGAELMLNTAYDDDERPPVPDPARIESHQDTCLYFGSPDVDGAYAFLQQKGVPSEPPKVSWYGMKQLYFTDPDGYSLCLQKKSDER